MNDIEAAKLYVDDQLVKTVETIAGMPVDRDSIKIYKDKYCKENEVLVGYKGKTTGPSGIVYCPYVKPTWYARLWLKIKSFLGIKSDAIEL